MITLVNEKLGRRFNFPLSYIFTKLQKTRKKRINLEQLHRFIELMVDSAWNAQRYTDNYGVYGYPFRITDGNVVEFQKDVLVFKDGWSISPESIPFLKGGKDHFNTIVSNYDYLDGTVYENLIKIDE
jgi:hypothetical protein